MIKNERQLSIFRARAERLRNLRTDMQTAVAKDPARRELELRAVDAELRGLDADIADYLALQAGDFELPVVASLADLPTVLVRARIARRLTQRDLAERLGLKEQQIQRYESTDYAGASLSRLQAVADVLEVELVPSLRRDSPHPVEPNVVIRQIERLGLPRSLLRRRFIESEGESLGDLIGGVARVARVYGWSPDDLLSGRDVSAHSVQHGTALAYKKPRRASEVGVAALSTYAHHVTRCVAMAFDASRSDLPNDPLMLHHVIVQRHKNVSFRAALEVVWNHGVAVVPLAEPGGFHAGYWNHDGRLVIALNSAGRESARWLFDLCHEVGHIASTTPVPGSEHVEADPAMQEHADSEEQHANLYASDVMFGGRASELYRSVLDAAGGNVGMYQRCVRMVARHEKVSVGALAFAVAHRLRADQGLNWWPAALKLQGADPDHGDDPWFAARDLLVSKVDWAALPPLDLDIVARCLDLHVPTSAVAQRRWSEERDDDAQG